MIIPPLYNLRAWEQQCSPVQSQTSVFLVLLALVLPAFGQPYYVAPAGHDANPGTLEKPFGTLERAQRAVREKKGTVFLRGGMYYLREPLVFSAQDSEGRPGYFSGLPR